MERLKNMKEMLVSCTQAQMADLRSADCEELGAAIDMIKDLEEAIYYCTITKAMEKKQPHENEMTGEQQYNYYTEPYGNHYYDRDMDMGRMYYTPSSSFSGNNSSSGNDSSSMRGYSSSSGNRDAREGRSPMSRRMYMETKQISSDKTSHLRNLEHYMNELASDITEMIQNASSEEKQLLQQKLTTLAKKVND